MTCGARRSRSSMTCWRPVRAISCQEEEDEAETAADCAIAALETARKKKEEGEKWMRWAEMQYPDPRKTTRSAAVTSTGSAVVTSPTTSNLPLPNLKKPASSSTAAEIRAEISDMVRKQLVPALAEKYLRSED